MHTDSDSSLDRTDPDVFAAIAAEEARQQAGIELIPSENYTYPEVRAALGSVVNAKYAEGYPGKRYYGGQSNMDTLENLARERACTVFSAEHANVQPLSDVAMNQAVYYGLAEAGDTILHLDLSHGGHVTHGAPASHVSRVFNFVGYKTQHDGTIDTGALLALAKKVRPKIVLCGHSAYPRNFDYAAFRHAANEVGALAVADISHSVGLVAAGLQANPFQAGFDVVTTVTHKTLRGPRGGLILSRGDLAARLDASVFPGLQTAANMNAVAGAAIALKKAMTPAFRAYAEQVLKNARALADALTNAGVRLVTGGTDNHLMVIDTVRSFDMDGGMAESVLDRIGITVNKQIIPDDPNPPLHPSGLRLGTPACTTRGMRETDMEQLAQWMVAALAQPHEEQVRTRLRRQVRDYCRRFPVPGYSVVPSDPRPPTSS